MNAESTLLSALPTNLGATSGYCAKLHDFGQCHFDESSQYEERCKSNSATSAVSSDVSHPQSFTAFRSLSQPSSSSHMTIPSNECNISSNINNNNYINSTGNKLQLLLSSVANVHVCSRCGENITERASLKVADHYYHSTCTRCSVCHLSLREKCFLRDNKLFCNSDYFRRYGTKCSFCKEGILPCELVQKAGDYAYHLNCFQCKACQRRFEPGDEFFLVGDGKLLCRTDYEAAKAKQIADDSNNKRPRTIITAKQLASLKKIYNESPKPARHVREQLSIETDLEMRVVQVWFQNRRAKEKRMKKDLARRGGWNDGHGRSIGSPSSAKEHSMSDSSQMTLRGDCKDDEDLSKDEDCMSAINSEGCQYSGLQESISEVPPYKRRRSEFLDTQQLIP